MRAAILVASAISVLAADAHSDLLERVRARTLAFVNDLGNFTCTRLMTRHTGQAGKDRWRHADTTEEDFSIVGLTESATLRKLNGKPPKTGQKRKGPTYRSSGDFGPNLRWIFSPESETQFVWKGTELRDGRTEHVWTYRVPANRSKHFLMVNAWSSFVEFFGTFHADPGTVQIRRLTVEYDHPENQPVSAVKVVHFSPVGLGGREFMLPSDVEETARYMDSLTRIRGRFTNFRRFDAQSTIIED